MTPTTKAGRALLTEWTSAYRQGARRLGVEHTARRLAEVEQEAATTREAALRAALDSAVSEFGNIRWDDVWAIVKAADPELARWTAKYLGYVLADIERARALAATPAEPVASEARQGARPVTRPEARRG